MSSIGPCLILGCLLVGACVVGEGEGDEPEAAVEGAADEAPAPEITEIYATGNLLANSGFESWADTTTEAASWTQWAMDNGNGTIFFGGSQYVRRSYYARYSGYDGTQVTSPAAVDAVAWSQQIVGAIPGRTYQVHAKTRLIAGDQQVLYIVFRDSRGKMIHQVGMYTGWSTAWHELYFNATAPAGTTEVKVIFGDLGPHGNDGFPSQVWAPTLHGSTHQWDLVTLVAL